MAIDRDTSAEEAAETLKHKYDSPEEVVGQLVERGFTDSTEAPTDLLVDLSEFGMERLPDLKEAM